eukprot:gene5244-5479_t
MVLAQEAVSKVNVAGEKKRKMHLALKPGLVARTAAAPWAASSLPRTIRNRSFAKRHVKPGRHTPPSPSSPHQAVETNAVTGKRALGPWLGPFNPFSDGAPVASVSALPSHANTWDMLLPPTMYLDSKGALFLGLEVEEHNRFIRALQQAQEDSGIIITDASIAALQQATASAKAASEMMDLQRFAVRHAREVAVCATPALQKGPLQRSMMRRAGHINQPRRFN